MSLPLPYPHVADPEVQQNFEALSLAMNKPMPQARVSKAAVQAIASGGAGTACTFDTEVFDDGNLWISTANTRLTAPVTGLYLVIGHLNWASNGAGVRAGWVAFNGTGTRLATHEDTVGAATTHSFNVPSLYRMTAGQYVELYAYQTSGGNLDVTAVFEMTRLAGYSGEQF